MTIIASGKVPTAARLGSQRLLSPDVLRGLTVALMILVNNAGDGNVSYAQLRHSVWNGCTLTDLVFPNFLFIVGASIVPAFRNRVARGVSRTTILLQAARRSAVILALGLVLNAFPYFHLYELRYCGVLQRIAVCYLLVSAIYLSGGVISAAVALALSLGGYWWLMTHVPLPEFGMPGVDISVLDQTGNLASLLDRLWIPAAHMYHHGVYDPEGILSTLPALGTTLIGVLALCWVATSYRTATKVKVLIAVGVVCIGAGLLWSQSFPLNKRLWTSSFVLFTGGISLESFAILYWLVDGPPRKRRGLEPWIALGTNALTGYVLSELLAGALAAIYLPNGRDLQQQFYRLLPSWLGSPAFVSLIYSILFALLCALPVLGLYRRRIFIKL